MFFWVTTSENLRPGSVHVYYAWKGFYLISRLLKSNIRSGLCGGRATSTDHDMNSCLSCIPFKSSSLLPADCQTCMNKAKSEGGTLMQSSQGMNSSLCSLSCLFHSFFPLFFHPHRCRCSRALGETRWSNTGYSVCWGRRKRRGRANHRPPLSPQWVSRKWKQRYRTCYIQASLQYCNCIQQLQENHLRRSKLLFPPSLISENVLVLTTVQSTSSPGAWILLLHNSIVKLLITEQYTSCLATNPNCNCVSIPYSRVFIFKQVSQPFLNTDWDTKSV